MADMGSKRILVVMAHPDDETFGMGGTLAYYTSIGVKVSLICATKGEEGEIPPELLVENQTIADVREAELTCAAKVLGLESVHFLGYRDSGMAGAESNLDPRSLAAQSIDEVAGKITNLINKIKPQVILTFDPIGGYNHPDHVMIHQATLKAFFDIVENSGQEDFLNQYQPDRLYYHVISKKLMKVFVKLLKFAGKDPESFGKNGDIDINSFVNADFPIHVQIKTGKFQKKRKQAAACHLSQGAGKFGGRVTSALMDLFNRKESFMQAYPPLPMPIKIRGDFFNS
ncbi:PIG-L deacetylase family protein [Chloroflexota bacterium]